MEQNDFNIRPPVLQKETPKGGKKNVKVLTILVTVLGVLLLGGGSGYLVYRQFSERDVMGKANNPEYVSEIQQKQVDSILKDLGDLILITEEEEPTVATIVNVEVLREGNPDFYKHAQDGDILIIYSKRAIVFRRDENKIVNVAPVFIQPSSDQPAQGAEE